jgi:nucleoid-associated protein YgaU
MSARKRSSARAVRTTTAARNDLAVFSQPNPVDRPIRTARAARPVRPGGVVGRERPHRVAESTRGTETTKEIAVNKYLIIALWLAVVAVAGTGCAKKNATAKKSPAFSPAVTELSPSPTYTPAPVAAAPVFEPAAPVATYTPAPTQIASAGGSYTVKKGDTLFGIAKNRYGDGKQWSRITSANPGLSPATLKAGQTITLP